MDCHFFFYSNTVTNFLKKLMTHSWENTVKYRHYFIGCHTKAGVKNDTWPLLQTEWYMYGPVSHDQYHWVNKIISKIRIYSTVSENQKLESIQYNASLTIRGTSREKLYNELGFASLHARRWYRKLCYFCKFYVFKQPKYLFNLISVRTFNYRTRNEDDIPYFNIRHNFFKNSFFPPAVIEWNKLDSKLRKVKSLTDFKKNIL